MGFASMFAAAQTAIIMGAGISYPFDTVRRRLQMQAEKAVKQHICKGTADCVKKGVAAGLHKGFVANALRSVGGALVLVLYDRAKTYLSNTRSPFEAGTRGLISDIEWWVEGIHGCSESLGDSSIFIANSTVVKK